MGRMWCWMYVQELIQIFGRHLQISWCSWYSLHYKTFNWAGLEKQKTAFSCLCNWIRGNSITLFVTYIYCLVIVINCVSDALLYFLSKDVRYKATIIAQQHLCHYELIRALEVQVSLLSNTTRSLEGGTPNPWLFSNWEASCPFSFCSGCYFFSCRRWYDPHPLLWPPSQRPHSQQLRYALCYLLIRPWAWPFLVSSHVVPKARTPLPTRSHTLWMLLCV